MRKFVNSFDNNDQFTINKNFINQDISQESDKK